MGEIFLAHQTGVAGFTRREIEPVDPPVDRTADGSRALDYGSSFSNQPLRRLLTGIVTGCHAAETGGKSRRAAVRALC